MAYAKKEDQAAYNRKWRRANSEKVVGYSQKWVEGHRETKRAANRRAIGEPGSAKREAFNERRRLRRKRSVLAELERVRKHKESLREFITRKAA